MRRALSPVGATVVTELVETTVHAPGITLAHRLPEGGSTDPDRILSIFLERVEELGFELYPPQQEALLEVMAGHHVILDTPTGSGKSLVALGLHFKALCEGRRCFYTSPVKALASEKFFSLCQELGAENVGMLTGDASINSKAPVVCCTAEVLANMALRQGDELNAPYVVMDEFHYYSDPQRGVAWQVPLISLLRTQFLLMSATLGDTSRIAARLRRQTGREVAVVSSDVRPVPLDYEYRETPLHETVGYLLQGGRAPIYIVSFTQRDCAELAQSLTSMDLCSREQRQRIAKTVGDFRFDSPYGKELRRLIRFGVGVHHAGLLPKYRLLVEQLSQQGMLRVICGTDTLGVGVNIPIRTVVFTKLCKFDGRRVRLLTVREFKQIAGRAGRKGFDERGSVVCQAPEHVIENKRILSRAGKDAKKRRKLVKKKPPRRGFVPWDRETFDKLIARPPETLKSQFRVSHSMVLNLLQRDAELDDPERDNFSSLRRIIQRSHASEGAKGRLLRQAALLVWSLYQSGLIKMVRDSESDYLWVTVDEELQYDFSLHQTLALYQVEAIDVLDTEAPDYHLDVLSLVEAVLEDPDVVLRRQADKLRDELWARLKAEKVPYEERRARVEEVTHPQPLADFIHETFEIFRRAHPWVGGEAIRPKSIGREMFEGYRTFADFIRRYSLQRSEGVVLRYLSQLYKTLTQSVPQRAKTEGVYDALGFFRAMVERVDSSLLAEWESLLHPELALERAEERQAARQALRVYELFHDPRAFASRVRAELHLLVRALAEQEWEEAAGTVRQDPEDPWMPERFQEALEPFFEEYGELVFGAEARRADKTQIRQTGYRRWAVTQVLVDPQGDNMWCLEGLVDLRSGDSFEGPLVTLQQIGT